MEEDTEEIFTFELHRKPVNRQLAGTSEFRAARKKFAL